MALDLPSVLLDKGMSIVLPLLGLLSGVIPNMKLLAFVIPYSGTLRCDVTPVLALRLFT